MRRSWHEWRRRRNAMEPRGPLIRSPLEWQLTAAALPHPAIPVLAERGGTQLKTPRPVILVDTREQTPFDFSRFEGWFSGIEKKPLQLGDYSVAGGADLWAVVDKKLPDLLLSFSPPPPVLVGPPSRRSCLSPPSPRLNAPPLAR